MDATLYFLLLLLFSPMILLAIHVIASRIFIRFNAKVSPQSVAFLSVFIGYGVIGFFSWEIYLRYLAGTELWGGVAYMLLVYSGFSCSYFHIFNMSETARRIKILSDLFTVGSLGLETTLAPLTAKEQLLLRLERLLALGQIKKEGDRYLLKGRTFWFAAVILMRFRRVLKLGVFHPEFRSNDIC